jgi:hypothetical protein
VTRQIVGKVCFGISGDYGYEFTLLPTADGRLLFGDETVVFADETVELPVPKARRVSLGL